MKIKKNPYNHINTGDYFDDDKKFMGNVCSGKHAEQWITLEEASASHHEANKAFLVPIVNGLLK